MARQIPLEELPDEVLEKIGLGDKKNRQPRVSGRLAVLGLILVELKSLTVLDALWVLRKAGELIRRERDNQKAVNERSRKGSGHEGPEES